MHHLGGAVARAPGAATAFGHRKAQYLLNVLTRCEEAAESDRHVAWARELHASMTSSTTGGAYVNVLGDEGRERVVAAYDEESYKRLVALKDAYDPTNFFRVNQNIPPSSMHGRRRLTRVDDDTRTRAGSPGT